VRVSVCVRECVCLARTNLVYFTVTLRRYSTVVVCKLGVLFSVQCRFCSQGSGRTGEGQRFCVTGEDGRRWEHRETGLVGTFRPGTPPTNELLSFFIFRFSSFFPLYCSSSSM
jgi:hypothetical protein